MKKLLILAYDFPPYVSVGGLRPYAWYQYLKEFGVEPIVVTRQWENKHGNALDYIEASSSKETVIEETEFGTIIRAPYFPSFSNRILLKYGEKKYRLLRKAFTAFDEIRQFILPSGPKSTVYFAAKAYLKTHSVDAIIATGDPFVLFSFANKLSKENKIPWIADYRDPWSQDKNNSKGIINALSVFFERRILHSTTAVTTVSEFCKQKISTLAPNRLPFYILPNGYNPEAFQGLENISSSASTLHISFVGTIYDWHPWKSFLEVLAVWKQQHSSFSFQINFYGINKSEEIAAFIQHKIPEMEEKIKIFPRMANSDLMMELAKSHVLLLFNDYSILGTKIYDYLALHKKILLCYENDEKALVLKQEYYGIEETKGLSKRLQAEVIEKTNSGVVVQNEKHLFQVMDEISEEFQATGKILCQSTGVEQYSRKFQVEELSKIIQQGFSQYHSQNR